ncbi:MAG: hypothetical protein WC835_01755 [Candidatus Paceibacterota bacterium]|jgi:hypothetical protein
MKQVLGILILIIIFVGIVMAIRPGMPLSNMVNSFKIADYTFDVSKTPGYVNNYVSDTQSGSGPYAYQLSDISATQGMDAYGKIYYNAKLLRIYSDGRSDTIIESFRHRFPNLLFNANQMLAQYYFPRNSDILYFNFRDYYTKGVGDRYHIFKYDARADVMRDLLSNRYLTSYAVPSPYNPLLMLAVDDDITLSFQKLYLVDLETDSARLLFQLAGNETLASYAEQYGKLYGANINWVDRNTIQYSIYRNSNQQGVGFTFLGNKMLSL